MITVETWPVDTKHLLRFIKTIRLFYPKNHPYWVHPLILDTYQSLSPQENPLLKGENVALWVAKESDTIVGTLMGYTRYIKAINGKKAYFCQFEAIDSQTVANTLFDTFKAWAKSLNLKVLIGPNQPRSDEFSRGLLVQGFDDAPAVFNPYHHPYYQRLIETYGFKKDNDYFAYEMTVNTFDIERVEKTMDRLKQRYQLTIKPIDLKNMHKEAEDLVEIVRLGTPPSWDLHQSTVDEIVGVFQAMKLFYRPGLAFMARNGEGKPVGVVLGIPDIYELMHREKGRLFPTLILKLIFMKHTIKRGRVFMQYVIPEYQNKGINILIFYEMYRYLKETKSAITRIDGSTIGEENAQSFLSVTRSGGRLSKIYREYTFAIE